MTEPDGTSGQPPLVTFVVFAYNQERYIRVAVESALAQTYEPLEIVLSDDASSDRTFEIIQKLVAAYGGPHDVRIVRNPRNLGLVPHVLARGQEAKGEIVVVAAGDDVSNPERTTCSIAPFLDSPDVFAVASLVDVIDEKGEILAKNAVRPLHLGKPNIYVKSAPGMNEVIQGCAAAYRKEVFFLPLPEWKLEFPEDLLFSFYINVTGREIARIDRALVAYRSHDDALSNRSTVKRTLKYSERRTYEAALSSINMIEAFKFLSEKLGKPENVDYSRMDRNFSSSNAIVNWPETSFRQKLATTLKALFTLDARILKWVLLRVLT